MTLISKLLSGGVTDIVNSIGDIIDKFTLSKEEKLDFKLEVQSRLMQMDKELEETYQAELESRQEIIKAEMAQSDTYTKRARPTIIYGGLIFILIIHVVLPAVAYLAGTTPDKMPTLTLPTEFWWAWGTVVSIYGAGRSAEKLGIINKMTNLATGSGANKLNNKKTVG